jgi:hypothetical protein
LWRNSVLRARLIFSVVSFPLFVYLAILIFQYLGVPSPVSYILIFLSGLFYHFCATIFFVSAVYSYLKFLIHHRILLKLFIIIYFFGLIASILNCIIIIQLSSINALQFEVGQVYFAFLMSNFVFAPLGLLVCSFDFVKVDLFRSNERIYQARPIYLAVAIVSLSVFSLLLDAREEFGWSFSLIIMIMLGLIGFIGLFLKRIIRAVYVNCQNAIAE